MIGAVEGSRLSKPLTRVARGRGIGRQPDRVSRLSSAFQRVWAASRPRTVAIQRRQALHNRLVAIDTGVQNVPAPSSSIRIVQALAGLPQLRL